VAAMPKLRHPESFSIALYSYAFFPVWTIKLLAFLIPPLELIVGLSLTLWLSRAGRIMALFLFGGFTVVLTWARWHHSSLTCGCFGRIDSWLHKLSHGLLLHILGTLSVTLGLAILVLGDLRRKFSTARVVSDKLSADPDLAQSR